ncbi:hypothetical protein CD30_10175 [Ureibacillus massiliensis 4400831 = CIP 108448 = CCUG 49529]|uniref:Helix-hairpin-helix DNA-binding motif class 1 domain-containing protein n=1 Tax=Ureibacillus massiliensis 4400831 = CIP 108448 = CCUG 49529 TaxID=1211035 RepID=A0A0A3J6D2_9BACL|nr:helix-hairpin-helix domain-containing protein [Ureibacillus massiliensis]KGR90718.1 hypothetical protein CD30_10175 [Ureibacillus massiliensis 4400831 = CIP 108448 = CCUG 49529]RKJ59729.1 comEA protein [Butyricicoccus sp. 1XD8-22]
MFQEFLKKYGKSVLIPCILCFAILYIFLQQNNSVPQTDELVTTIPLPTDELDNDEQSNEITEDETNQTVFIDIKGAVKHPGVYELQADDRIIDAIELAGGYRDDAVTEVINHAQKVQDEMVIYVPKKGEISEEIDIGQVVSSSTTTISSSETENTVNINLADESELLTLPGIGPSKAQAILAYREEIGKFQSIDDLKNVSGIGEKTFEKLKDYISIN